MGRIRDRWETCVIRFIVKDSSLTEGGLQTELSPALLRHCIDEFMRQHSAGQVGSDGGNTLLHRLESRLQVFWASLPASEMSAFVELWPLNSAPSPIKPIPHKIYRLPATHLACADAEVPIILRRMMLM